MKVMLLLVLVLAVCSPLFGALIFSAMDAVANWHRLPRWMKRLDFELFGFIAAIAAGAFFTDCLFYLHAKPYNTLFFWTVLGAMVLGGGGWIFAQTRGFNRFVPLYIHFPRN